MRSRRAEVLPVLAPGEQAEALGELELHQLLARALLADGRAHAYAGGQ